MDATDFLRRRKDRACAIVLHALEKEQLPRQAHERVRKAILDQFNDYYAGALDVIQSVDTGTVVVNEIWLERLEQIYEKVVLNGDRHAG